MRVFGILTLLLLWPPGSHETQDAPLDIRLHSGTALEQRGREQLTRILQKYNLEKWLFTRSVVIQSRVIPHSHPVLTLNTQYVEDDVAQLATLLHEQLHWFITDHVPRAAAQAAIEEFRRLFPQVPAKPPEGARDEYSTYLHLIVCYLELEALSELVGLEAARAKLAAWNHYTWVYSKVLSDTATIRDIVQRHIGPVRKTNAAAGPRLQNIHPELPGVSRSSEHVLHRGTIFILLFYALAPGVALLLLWRSVLRLRFTRLAGSELRALEPDDDPYARFKVWDR